MMGFSRNRLRPPASQPAATGSRGVARSPRRRAGTSMLETALTLPLLLLLVLGTIEFGLIFARYQILLGSAREGARIASLFRPNCNARRVKSEVDRAVMSNGNQLGMLLLPTNVTLTGACTTNNVDLRLHYDHYLTLVGGFLGAGATVPLDVRVVMRNETS